MNDLDKLAALIKQAGPALLSRWRQQVRELPSARHLDIPTLNDHMPGVLGELARALESHSDQTIPESLSGSSPPAHRIQRVQDALDIEEVVAEYNILRGCIHDLADENGLILQGKPFHIINRVFDRAIALALKAYVTARWRRSGGGKSTWPARSANPAQCHRLGGPSPGAETPGTRRAR